MARCFHRSNLGNVQVQCLRVRSHWASNFASASTSNSQMQTQSYSLNWVSNPFHFNRELSRKFSHKLITMLVYQFEQTLIKWVWYSIDRVTLRLCLLVTRRRIRRRKVPRSMWTDPYSEPFISWNWYVGFVGFISLFNWNIVQGRIAHLSLVCVHCVSVMFLPFKWPNLTFSWENLPMITQLEYTI